MSSLKKNRIADVHHAFYKCESLDPGQLLILHGNPSAIAAKFPKHMAVLRRHFYRVCISSAACDFKAPSVAILNKSLRPVVNPLLGCSSRNPFQDQLAWGFVLWPNSTSSTALDPCAWTMVVFWKDDSGRQPPFITQENGGDETSSTSPPKF